MRKFFFVSVLLVFLGALVFSFFVGEGKSASKSLKYVGSGSSDGFVDSGKFYLPQAFRDYVYKRYPSGLIPLPLKAEDEKALEKYLGGTPGYIVKFKGSSLEALKSGFQYSQGLSVKDREKMLEEQESYLISTHDYFKRGLLSIGSSAQVRREYYQVFNGLSLRNVSLDELFAISRMDSVERIYPIKTYKTLLSDSVPQIGATEAWKMNDSLGSPLKGKGVKIAIIDTGVDYTHPDLGSCTLGAVGGEDIHITGTPYSLSSPHPYSPEMNMTWNITMENYSKIAIHISRLSTEDSFDILYVKNASGDVVQELTGNDTDFWTYGVEGQTITLNLVSDDNIEGWGFEVDAVYNGSADFGAVGCAKVVAGYDFVNNDNNPMDDHGHGTHCASIAAGNGSLKGVAPDARIMAYKVMDAGGSGYDDDIIAAIEKAVLDGADVISMSLGGSGDAYDSMSTAVDEAVDAGTVVAVAAGNSGPNNRTIGSPGTARKAVTVGASYLLDDAARGRESALEVLVNGSYKPMQSWAFKRSAVTSGSIDALLMDAGTATEDEFQGKDFSGKAALIKDLSSYISFHDQVENAHNAGCVAALIFTGASNDTVEYYLDYYDVGNLSAIPALLLQEADGKYLKELLDNGSFTVRMNVSVDPCPVTEFSSRGPAQIFEKPDVLAPGYKICAARSGVAFSDYEGCMDSRHVRLSGTSMATPHVAGAAALVIQKNPTWSPLQVKAALKYTARSFGASPTIEGSGLINVSAALSLDSPPPVAQIYDVSNVSWNQEAEK